MHCTVQAGEGDKLIAFLCRAQLFAKIAEFHAYKVSMELLSELVDLCQDDKKEFQNPSQLISDVRENTRFLYPG